MELLALHFAIYNRRHKFLIFNKASSDVELHDNYAKVYLSEHGKEGVHGFLRCIDSFPYLVRWLEEPILV